MSHRNSKTSTPMPPSDRRYLNAAEAAAYLSTTRWCISAAMRQKKLSYLKLGKKFLVTREALDAFALAQTVVVKAVRNG